LRQFYIDVDGVRQNPQRALLMDSPQPGMMQTVHFDFDSINYFLDQDGDVCSMALMELQVLDWHFQVVVNTVELRSKAFDELHKQIQAHPVVNSTLDLIPTLYSAQYGRLATLTDHMIEQVDEGIASAKKMYTTMQTALQIMFPGQDFLKVNFVEQPKTQQ